MKKFVFRLCAGILTFTIGITVAALCRVNHYQMPPEIVPTQILQVRRSRVVHPSISLITGRPSWTRSVPQRGSVGSGGHDNAKGMLLISTLSYGVLTLSGIQAQLASAVARHL